MRATFEKTARFRFHPGFILLYVALFSLWFAQRFPGLLLLPCPIKSAFSIPCIACGSGRSLSALLNLEFYNALIASPLFILILLISILIVLAALQQLIFGLRLSLKIPESTIRFGRYSFILALIANYFWLLLMKI